MAANRPAEAILGAHLADAAALGLHWLYDPERIAALKGPIAFRPPDPADYEGARGVFVHHGRRAGQGSHYGEQMRVMTRAILAAGEYRTEIYASAFLASFGPGGSWVGYADRATRGSVEGIAHGRHPSGAEDDQMPAVVKLPPLIARLRGQAWEAVVAEAVAVTSNHPVALAWAPAAAAALHAAMAGAGLHAALHAGVRAVPGRVGQPLHVAMEHARDDPVAFAGRVGRACAVTEALPVAFQILARAGSFREAVLDNIRAGGDSCGRGIFIGAMAAMEWGVTSAPLDWLLKLEDGAAIWAEAQALAALGG
ncbi:MAG: ADP-ribosylglycohydrolase [Paracoccaceae bacterium]|nr:MAG: ADP-ribosylglycohydrolase [Paracoccaceae bacterium]